MQMFELKSFDVCQTTGITSYEMHWDVGRGRRVDRGSFIDRRDAERYISSSKRSYILIMFQNFVSHSRVLFETGHKDFYRTPGKLEALDKCQKYNLWFQDKSLDAICKVVLALQEDLRKILPSPNNPSYSSSEERILEMVIFSKKELANLPKLKV